MINFSSLKILPCPLASSFALRWGLCHCHCHLGWPPMLLEHAASQLSAPPLHCLCAALLVLSALNALPTGQLLPWKVPGVVLQIKLYG